MVEYGVLVSKSSEIFSNFYWQMRNIWNDMPWEMAVLIVFGIFIIVYFLLRNR
ncbi:MAG TPA: hypothetical protein PK425_08885 [Syntrophales bacterium]|nr:hypothetical protein [Syntrophales bacterium]